MRIGADELVAEMPRPLNDEEAFQSLIRSGISEEEAKKIQEMNALELAHYTHQSPLAPSQATQFSTKAPTRQQ